MYLLDSNIFIEAKNRYYAFDICPGFWTWLEQAAIDGPMASISKVYDELAAGNDALAEWIDNPMLKKFFLEIDDNKTQAAFREVAKQIQNG